ncbi:hypothetical protein [Leekyejoonella antrihumi]|uniref:Uncharacterized protein n=1 Tax=Leekyejoonella antrihumi TaxID=1660198 RepID=A0A563DWX6_9MICO|nr:hypothetical protein FGL98_17130 [Leekyejoonella antrihumi]
MPETEREDTGPDAGETSQHGYDLAPATAAQRSVEPVGHELRGHQRIGPQPGLDYRGRPGHGCGTEHERAGQARQGDAAGEPACRTDQVRPGNCADRARPHGRGQRGGPGLGPREVSSRIPGLSRRGRCKPHQRRAQEQQAEAALQTASRNTEHGSAAANAVAESQTRPPATAEHEQG